MENFSGKLIANCQSGNQMETPNNKINAIDAAPAPGVENSTHENDDVIAQQQTPNACSKSSSRSSPDNADVHSVTKEHNRQLRLVCPNHKEININRLEKWKLQNHHRAIVNLLLCLAGSEVWSSAPNTKAGREDRILIAYKRWVAVWKKAQPFCRVNAFLMYNSTTKPKEFSKHILERRFRECVRQPLAKCSATCIRFLQHPDFNNGKTPIDDRQWLEVLEKTEKWWYMQECIRKEMDSRRRKRNKYNNSAAVKSGRIARSESPIAIEEGWEPRSMQSEDPLIPLISRFCPVLCAGLGFAKSPISSFSGLRPENLTSLLQTPKSITSQPENRNMQSQEKASNVDNEVDVHNKQHSVETNEEQVRLMRSMSEEHNRNIRPAKRKVNADRNKDWASLIKQERKERESKQKNLLRRVELLRNKLIRCPEEKQKYKKEIIQLTGNELDILTLPDPVAGNPATFEFVNLHEAGDVDLGLTDGLSPPRKKTTVAVAETQTVAHTCVESNGNDPNGLSPPPTNGAVETTEMETTAVTALQSVSAETLDHKESVAHDSLTHSLTHSLSHSLTHSFTLYPICSYRPICSYHPICSYRSICSYLILHHPANRIIQRQTSKISSHPFTRMKCRQAPPRSPRVTSRHPIPSHPIARMKSHHPFQPSRVIARMQSHHPFQSSRAIAKMKPHHPSTYPLLNTRTSFGVPGVTGACTNLVK